MKLDKTQLLELMDYIEALNDNVGLNDDIYNDITKAIDRELDKIRQYEHLINHIDEFSKPPSH